MSARSTRYWREKKAVEVERLRRDAERNPAHAAVVERLKQAVQPKPPPEPPDKT